MRAGADRIRPIDEPCRTCGAEIGEQCRRLGSGMHRFRYVDGFHKWRRDAAEEANRVLTD